MRETNVTLAQQAAEAQDRFASRDAEIAALRSREDTQAAAYREQLAARDQQVADLTDQFRALQQQTHGLIDLLEKTQAARAKE